MLDVYGITMAVARFRFEQAERLGGERVRTIERAVRHRAERVAVECHGPLDGIVGVAVHSCSKRRHQSDSFSIGVTATHSSNASRPAAA